MKNFFNKLITKYPRLYEIFKFCLIGGLTTLIDMFVMAAVIYLFNPKIYSSFLDLLISKDAASTAAVIVGTGLGFLLGAIVSYIFSIIFVFKSSDTNFAKTKLGFISFILLSSIGLFIHLLGMYLGYDLLHINEWIVKIFLTLVVLVFNYISRKKIIFKKNSPAFAADRAEETTTPNDAETAKMETFETAITSYEKTESNEKVKTLGVVRERKRKTNAINRKIQ